MRLNLLRTTAFRWAFAVSGGYVAITILLWAFIYWQTTILKRNELDGSVISAADFITAGAPSTLDDRMAAWMAIDLHRQKIAGVFAPGGAVLAGNLAALPAVLPDDHRVHQIHVVWHGPRGLRPDVIRAVVYHEPDGRIVIVGRDIDDLQAFRMIVARALAIGLALALMLSLAVGTFLGLRAQRRIRSIHKAAARIMRGRLHDRLPTANVAHDDLDKVAAIVNRMLERIGELVADVRHVSDNIAHDLRTPLMRVRARLERSRGTDMTREQLQGSIDSAIGWIDQTLAMITALLRISEVEYGACREHFQPVDLSETLDSINELYEPLAQQSNIGFEVRSVAPVRVMGDRELLFEAVANLVDNAIKFTPDGGQVSVALAVCDGDAVIEVRDNGPGIPPAEREAVRTRFYRADKSRHIAGNGLGMSLVVAIMAAHGGSLVIEDVDIGCSVILRCALTPLASTPHAIGAPRDSALPAPILPCAGAGVGGV